MGGRGAEPRQRESVEALRRFIFPTNMEGFAPLGFFGEEEDAETDLFPDVEETTGGARCLVVSAAEGFDSRRSRVALRGNKGGSVLSARTEGSFVFPDSL